MIPDIRDVEMRILLICNPMHKLSPTKSLLEKLGVKDKVLKGWIKTKQVVGNDTDSLNDVVLLFNPNIILLDYVNLSIHDRVVFYSSTTKILRKLRAEAILVCQINKNEHFNEYRRKQIFGDFDATYAETRKIDRASDQILKIFCGPFTKLVFDLRQGRDVVKKFAEMTLLTPISLQVEVNNNSLSQKKKENCHEFKENIQRIYAEKLSEIVGSGSPVNAASANNIGDMPSKERAYAICEDSQNIKVTPPEYAVICCSSSDNSNEGNSHPKPIIKLPNCSSDVAKCLAAELKEVQRNRCLKQSLSKTKFAKSPLPGKFLDAASPSSQENAPPSFQVTAVPSFQTTNVNSSMNSDATYVTKTNSSNASDSELRSAINLKVSAAVSSEYDGTGDKVSPKAFDEMGKFQKSTIKSPNLLSIPAESFVAAPPLLSESKNSLPSECEISVSSSTDDNQASNAASDVAATANKPATETNEYFGDKSSSSSSSHYQVVEKQFSPPRSATPLIDSIIRVCQSVSQSSSNKTVGETVAIGDSNNVGNGENVTSVNNEEYRPSGGFFVKSVGEVEEQFSEIERCDNAGDETLQSLETYVDDSEWTKSFIDENDLQ